MLRISTQMISERSLSSMLDQQSKVSTTQLQLSTGRRIVAASDDPAGAARILSLNGAVDTVSQYQTNISRLTSRLETEETALEGISNVLQRVNELTIQGNNGTLTLIDSTAIAAEIAQLRDQLFSMSNSRDSEGEYVFGGFQTESPPFSYNAGVYSYNGDTGQRQLQVSPDRTIADGDNGFDTFMDSPALTTISVPAATAFTAVTGGHITIDGGNGNGAINVGGLAPAADADERSTQLMNAINAITSQTGVSAMKDTDSTIVLSALGGTGVTVAFAGATATTATTGLTAATIQPVISRSIFGTLDAIVTELEQNNRVDHYIEDVHAALNTIIATRTTVGARLNAVGEQKEVNEDLKLVLESHRSEEEDLDYAEAITRFERQMTALEAAQKAYVKVQQLSLFNFL